MLRVISSYRRFFGSRTLQTSRRSLCAGKNADNGNDGDMEDEFEEMSFNIGVEEDDDLTIQVDEGTSDTDNITPELASEMVSRMVAAATKKPTSGDRLAKNILPAITPHTISVLRASRITTNEVFAPGTFIHDYPINRKVLAVINAPQLNLSAPASEALKILAGTRYKDDKITISCDKFRTSAENQAYAISRVDKLVRAAKDAVGDDVDVRELASWEEVSNEVSMQLAEEGAPHFDFLLAKKYIPTETVASPPRPSVERN